MERTYMYIPTLEHVQEDIPFVLDMKKEDLGIVLMDDNHYDVFPLFSLWLGEDKLWHVSIYIYDHGTREDPPDYYDRAIGSFCSYYDALENIAIWLYRDTIINRLCAIGEKRHQDEKSNSHSR